MVSRSAPRSEDRISRVSALILQTGGSRFGFNEPADILLPVRIAFDGKSISLSFKKLTERRVLLQPAGFDDERAMKRRIGEQRFKRGDEILQPGIDPNRTMTAEQPDRIGFVDEAKWIRRQKIAIDADELERIVRISDAALDDLARPLADQTDICPKHEIGEDMARWTGKQAIRLVVLDGDHASDPIFAARSPNASEFDRRASLRRGFRRRVQL